MANNDTKNNLVDISSNSQIRKVYNKKGRIKRILCIVFSIIFLIGGSGMIYVYSLLNSLNYKEIKDDPASTSPTAATANNSGDFSGFTVDDGELLQDSKVLNVMLFGEDNHGADEKGRSDTMIML